MEQDLSKDILFKINERDFISLERINFRDLLKRRDFYYNGERYLLNIKKRKTSRFSGKVSEKLDNETDKILFEFNLIIPDFPLMNLLISRDTKKILELSFKKFLLNRDKFKENNFSSSKKQKFYLDLIFNKKRFKFANECFFINIISKNRNNITISFKDNIFTINLNKEINKLKNNEKNLIFKKILNILSKLFLDRIKKEVEKINKETFNYHYDKILLKDIKSYYGRCVLKGINRQKEIYFNLIILNFDETLRRYIIIHELSHLKYLNHKREFWKNVEKFVPDYKEIKKRINDNDNFLILSCL